MQQRVGSSSFRKVFYLSIAIVGAKQPKSLFNEQRNHSKTMRYNGDGDEDHQWWGATIT